jgi:hypothetical protein
MKIRQQYGVMLVVILLCLGLSAPSFALRCGSRLVSKGDTKYEVIRKCGEPDFVDAWEEELIQRDFGFRREFDSESRRYTWHREPFLVKETVRIEEWTYNFGSTRFLRYLRFENGILTSISSGDKGF